MHRVVVAVACLLSIFIGSPASAQVVITHAKALAGGVTPGDTPGYPVTISQPGAYVLGSNLTVTPGTYGLFATANNVDIDLKGFTLSGNGGATYGLISGLAESRIHGGVISGFRYSGIYLRNIAWTIEDMKIVRNSGYGIDATGMKSVVVRNSLISSNMGEFGMRLGTEGVIDGNSIVNNGNYGLFCDSNCHVTDNTVTGHVQFGVYAISGTVSNNVISNNANLGIFDDAAVDLAILENTLINNNPNGTQQVVGGVFLYGNTCIGNPCKAP